jgi:hypothetical protein
MSFKDKPYEGVGCEKIRDTYKQLLSSYECFTKPEIVLQKFATANASTNRTTRHNHGNPGNHNNSHSNHGSHASHASHGSHSNHGNQSHHNSHGGERHHKYDKNRYPKTPMSTRNSLADKSSFYDTRKPIVAPTDNPIESVKRQLKGFLNIINKRNYSKVVSRIQRIVNPSSIQTIIEMVLDTACLQVFYISIFYNVLSDVLACGVYDEAHRHLNTYVNEFIEKKEYIYTRQESDTTSHANDKYFWFCQQQKHKLLATSKNIVILELLKNKHSDTWTVQEYCDSLLEELTLLNINIQSEDEVILFNIDIAITLMKEIKTRYPDTIINAAYLRNLMDVQTCQRTKFMLEDMVRSV